MIIIDAGEFIDGTGRSPRKNVRLFLEGKKIKRIEAIQSSSIPEESKFISAERYCVLPGLIDCHLHVAFDGRNSTAPVWGENIVTEMLPGTLAYRAYINAYKDLTAGFTSIRDMHCFDFVDVSLRDTINQGQLIGPRISAGGYGLTSTNGHMDYIKGLRPDLQFSGRFNNIVDDASEARKAVRSLIRMGVDHIKINVGRGYRGITNKLIFAPEMQFDVIQTICDEAHLADRKVAAHSLGGQGELWAVQAGVDSMEHAHFVDDETLQLMAERGTYLVPTMTHCVRNEKIVREKKDREDQEEDFMEYAYRSMYAMLSKAVKYGVRIGVGTDAGADHVPHGSNASELEYLTTIGFSTMEAIVAATKTGAEILGLGDEVGTLEPGKTADLLIVDGNPLEDIRVLQDPSKFLHIIKDGKCIKREGFLNDT